MYTRMSLFPPFLHFFVAAVVERQLVT
jgi:hypothetical protein